jgi:hypothetical protein
MRILLAYLVLIFPLGVYAQTSITPADLKIVMGHWEGSITYLDYSTNKPFTMPADLVVEQGKDENKLVLNNIYPDEPRANNSDKIRITKNGQLLNKHEVTSREEIESGLLQIQTEHEGKDDNKKALIRYTYIIGTDIFVIRKEVQFNKDGDWIRRSEFNYSRKE